MQLLVSDMKRMNGRRTFELDMLVIAVAFLMLVLSVASALDMEGSLWFFDIIFWLGTVLDAFLAWINIRKERYVLGGVCIAAVLICLAAIFLPVLAH